MNPFRDSGPYTEMCRKCKIETTIYYGTDATDGTDEDPEDMQTGEQPPPKRTPNERPNDAGKEYIRHTKVAAKGRKTTKTQRPRPNRPPEPSGPPGQEEAEPIQGTQTQQDHASGGGSRDEFKEKFRAMNLS